MSSLSDLFLTGAITYGAPALGAGIFIAALGVPLPATLFVVFGGAFVSSGVLEPLPTALIAFCCTIAGDCGAFALGRFARGPIERKMGGTPAWQKARAVFDRSGRLAVFLSRFWLTPLALPVNLIAGGISSFWSFLLMDLAGEFIWISVYGTLGYLFGEQYEEVSTFLTNFSGFSIGLLALAVGIYFGVRLWRRQPRSA